MKTIRRWMSLALVVCLLAMLPAPALMEGVEAGTGFPVDGEVSASTSTAEDETITSPSPSASAAAEGESITSPSPSASTAAESETVTSPSPSANAAAESETVTSPSPSASAAAESETVTSPSPSASAAEGETITSPSPSAETSSAPTDAAEGRPIASFEAVAPEGLSASRGTPETGLGLPASLNVQFSDGAVGEILVTWQCAAGYDPNAEVGMQFTFAAVLPQGYALSEGVSSPEILVTLTLPLANAMLAAQASGTGWTLSDEGKLTVTGMDVNSYALYSSWNNVKSIEVTGFFVLSDGMSFSGTITVLERGKFHNYGNVSATIGVGSNCDFMNNGTISGGTVTGPVYNHGTISGGALTGPVHNSATISGGTFTGEAYNYDSGTIIAGTFSNVAFDGESKALTITGNVDLSNGSTLAPLTIELSEAQSITVEAGGTFNAGDNAVAVPVTNRGTITSGMFEADIYNYADAAISGGIFNGQVSTSIYSESSLEITGGVFQDLTVRSGSVTGCTINGLYASSSGVITTDAMLNYRIHNKGEIKAARLAQTLSS